MEQKQSFETWQKCPKCNGQGVVSWPPNTPGDVLSTVTSQTMFECDVCNSRKIISVFTGLPPTLEPIKAERQ